MFVFALLLPQVLYNGSFATLRDVVEEQRKLTPKPALNYYKIEDAPTADVPGNFQVARTHSIYFIPAGQVVCLLVRVFVCLLVCVFCLSGLFVSLFV